MTDQWRATVREVAGQPVAMVEISIKRTIFIDALIWEQVERILDSKNDAESSGVSGVKKFWELAATLPRDAMPYFSVPWSDADARRIGAKPLAEIQALTDRSSYFRIEGSAAAGFVGVLNFGGQDRRIDLSEAGIPVFLKSLEDTQRLASEDVKANKLSSAEEQLIREYCENIKQQTQQCRDEFAKVRQWEMERNRDHKERLEKQIRDADILRSTETHRGDFGAGYGDRFKDTA